MKKTVATKTAAAWPVIKTYDEAHLLRIAMPLGGVGTGTVSLGGRGDLRDWEVMNRPAKGYSPKSVIGNTYPFFAIYAKPEGAAAALRALEGPLDVVEYEGAQGCSTHNHGLPRFRQCEFAAAYPLAQVRLSDDDMPVSVTLEAFNPFVPCDADKSGIPMAALRYVVRNTTNRRLTVSICGSVANFIGADGSQATADWAGGKAVGGCRANRNVVRQGRAVRGVFMTSDGVAKDDAAWGTFALTTTATAGITARTAWAKRNWGDSRLDFWDDFSADGELDERPAEGVDSPMASLAVKFRLAPRAEHAVTFLLTWHFPNRYTWTPQAQPQGKTGALITKAITALEVSPVTSYPGTIRTVSLPTGKKAPAFAARNFADGFCKMRPEIEAFGTGEGLLYYRHRFACDEAMRLDVLLGYDGPVKAWLDGNAVFCDPAGTNPAVPGNARIPVTATAGDHELVVALGTNAGKAWGLFLQYERTDLSSHQLLQLGPGVRLPRFAAPTGAAGCGCADGQCGNPDLIGNYYTTRYADAWAVAEQTAPVLKRLEAETVAFVRAFCESPLPEVVKEAALFNLSTLRTQTCFRTPDGRFYAWEGCNDNGGCCHGSCTHVWNYEMATAFLFGELNATMREVEFAQCTADSGHMSFRVNLPLTRAQSFGGAAADGQLGCLMKLYRDWQLSGDDGMLKTLWPNAKKALAFCWIPGGWDGDQDGVMEGCQHNTMDVEYYGPNPQMQGWYLGALRAGEEMARQVGDAAFAATCRGLFEKGRAWADKHLFNGDYYEHEIRPPGKHGKVAEGLRLGMGAADPENPILQLGAGCLVDQLVGQYFAHAAGLGYLLDQAHVRKTLLSILKYNYKQGFTAHFNHMRSYVLGNESALLMATYPKGRRPAQPFPYYTEVMTGFEYTAAVHMLYEGMEKEALQVIQAIRERYDGRKRSPFDEAECGHHYGRAMASWAAVLALTGFHYSGVTQKMAFKALPSGQACFWSTGFAWGTCRQSIQGRRRQVELSVLGGLLRLKSLTAGSRTAALPAARTLRTGQKLALLVG